jgi:hypothetical protein
LVPVATNNTGENDMPAMIKPSGPQGAARPYHPLIDDEDPAKRIAHALEHIAVVLSGIDHNIDALASTMIIKNRGAPR